MLKILCSGAQWLGSDDGGLFRGFQKRGHIVNIVDPFYYYTFDTKSIISKIIQRLTSRNRIREYNLELIKQASLLKPELFVVYKGAYVLPETIKWIRRNIGCPVINVYPDMSFLNQGRLIKKSVNLYDHIFTTKNFGIKDLVDQFNYSGSTLIHHAMDADIHKIYDYDSNSFKNLLCDISFIGGYSEKKEAVLQHIIESFPDKKIRIFGGGWDRSKSKKILSCTEGSTIYGALYAIAIQCSTINLGILTEQPFGASSGDVVTARSFHIPGSGGFMLHERTSEILEIFDKGLNIVTYESLEELTDKIKFYLENPEDRERIRVAGYEFVNRYHTQSNRADFIVETLKIKGLLKGI